MIDRSHRDVECPHGGACILEPGLGGQHETRRTDGATLCTWPRLEDDHQFAPDEAVARSIDNILGAHVD